MNKTIFCLFIGIICLSGCKKGDNSSSLLNSNSSKINSETTNSSNFVSSSSSSSSDTSSSSSVNPTLKYELDTPLLTLNRESGVVTWEEVEGAIYYNYIINDQNALTTTGTTLELEDKSNVSVQAVGENDISKWSNAVTFYDTSDVTLEGDGNYYSVYFHDSNIETKKVLSASKVERPTNPVKPNYIFENWYQDPFYTTLFDFDKPITENTVVYAHYTPTDLVNNVYYWIKANDKISSTTQSKNSGWKFIPLFEDENSSPKTFSSIVTVSNASSSSSADFLVMDGFDDNAGRTYFKNGSSDFSIKENGTFKITFSLETLYKLDNNEVHVEFKKVTLPNYANIFIEEKLNTPVIEVDGDNNMAFISEVEGADSYEVIINNEAPKTITTNNIVLNKQSHITVRAVKNNTIYSNWSIPKANINYVFEEVIEPQTYAYVYFYEANQNALKVDINTYVEEVTPTKEGYNFLGWYLDLAKTQKAEFPYLVTKNVVFYPKWESKEDVSTKEYFYLIDSENNKISGLTWNMDNMNFYEYETPEVTLNSDETYYIQSIDGTKQWGPYEVSSTGQYVIYFSDEYLWNENTDNESSVYISKIEQKTTLYFSNSYYWSGTIYAYLWNSDSKEHQKSWPGTEMEFVRKNSQNQSIYSIEYDPSKYDYIIFSNGSYQTIDIKISDNADNGFYINGQKDEKYTVGYYKYS